VAKIDAHLRNGWLKTKHSEPIYNKQWNKKNSWSLH